MAPKKEFALYIEAADSVVANVPTVKKVINYMYLMGYNKLYLGCADTIEVEGEPYFGYMRGRYTPEQIREIDAYCIEKDITFVLNTQTLAHQRVIPAYEKYKKIMDNFDTLLCDDDNTYEFIEKIIKTIAENTSSKIIHLGMDEAFLLGAGNYLKKNGYVNKREIFLRHLKRVCGIAEKYGLECEIWGDMFYHAINSVFTTEDEKQAAIQYYKSQLPSNVKLVYWNYSNKDKASIEDGIDKHKLITDKLAYAATLYRWIGYAPDNQLSLRNAKVICDACDEKGVNELMLTVWADSGGDSSLFSILPAMYVYSEIYYKRATSIKDVDKERFKDIVGIGFDDFLYIDKLNKPYNKKYESVNNKSFLYLYNDPFIGLFDSMLTDGLSDAYKRIAKKLKSIDGKELSYLFNTLANLALVLADKCDLGKNLRKAYNDKDLDKLYLIANKVIKRLIKNLKELSNSLEVQWEIENKPFGLEIQTARLGALILRLEYVQKTVNRYLKGQIESIAELEEKQLPFGYRLSATEDDYFLMCWINIFTSSVCH